MKFFSAMKFAFVVLVVLLGVQVSVASNRKMMEEGFEVAPQPAATTVKSAVSSAAAASPEEEEIKNHHTIPRDSWDDGTFAQNRG